jgi:hypothetical protein
VQLLALLGGSTRPLVQRDEGLAPGATGIGHRRAYRLTGPTNQATQMHAVAQRHRRRNDRYADNEPEQDVDQTTSADNR